MTRIGEESDVRKLTPHGWRENFADEVKARTDDALALIMGSA